MKELYESNISNFRWLLYDIPGNTGWILYFVCTVQMIRQDFRALSAATLVPAILMLVGIVELISERIVKLDRILPKIRLLRGFGALTLGGILGTVVSVFRLIKEGCGQWMLLGAVLCAVFAGLLYKGYRKAER
ncbi:MAG: hypothetical protein ACI4MP_13530 [Candidatus Ventricola sp.]